MTRAKRNRLVLGLTFAVTNVCLFLFALIPLNTVIWAEVLVAVVAVLSFGLVLLNVSDRAHQSPFVRMGYLLTGLNSLYTAAAFIATYDSGANLVPPMVLLLLATSLGGISAHIVMEDSDG